MAMQLTDQEKAQLQTLQSIQSVDAWTKQRIVEQIFAQPTKAIDGMTKKVSALISWFNAGIAFGRELKSPVLLEAFTQYRCNVGNILTSIIQWDSFDEDQPDGTYRLRNVYYVYLNQQVKLQLDADGNLTTGDRSSLLCLGMGSRDGLAITPDWDLSQFKKTPLDEATFLYLISQYLIAFSDGRPAPFIFNLKHTYVKGI